MGNRILIFSLGLFLSISAFTQNTYTLLDAESKDPLIGATVRGQNNYYLVVSDFNGNFEIPKNIVGNIIISYIGYETDTLSDSDLTNSSDNKFYLNSKTYLTDEAVIEATRVDQNAPATVTNVSKEEIEEINLGQDIPYLLRRTPSAVTTSDAGNGVGYTGIRIRGSDASRINVTINGVPLNDAESHGVFWVNMPDFASSLESMQIQRGIGTSTNGAGAFGATINLQTTDLNAKAYAETNNSFGSFNTLKNTLRFGSGLVNGKYAFEGRLSNIQSNGYIDRATADLQSYFLSGGYYGDKTVIKFITFGGNERTYQSWYGTPEAKLNGTDEELRNHYNRNIGEIYNNSFDEKNLFTSGRSYNVYGYENQVDDYSQDHYQLHLTHSFSSKTVANLSLHYTKGEGFFEEYKESEDFADYNLTPLIYGFDTISSTPLVRRRWLDNDFYGLTFSILHDATDQLNFTLGGGANRYDGDHFGEIIWSQFASNSFLTQPYYFNDASKTDANVFLKTTYDINTKTSLLVDLQVRSILYETEGTDNDQRFIDIDENYFFFNPKIGLNYQIDRNFKTYLFAGIGNREPNRADLVDQDELANKAEQMLNIEVGTEYRKTAYYVMLNLYAMEYTNQLVVTGQLNDVGSPIRQNVGSSYRRGIELQTGLAIVDNVNLYTSATFSRNRIKTFNEIIYDYTNGFEIFETTQENTSIALSPEIIVNSELSFQASKNLEIGFITNYVSEQYLDNTQNEDRKLDQYLVNDVRVEWKIKQQLFSELRLQLLVNNVFSRDYASNGYTYTYIFGQSITENFYYPQAFRNYLASVNIRF